jgi:hypothetical protein
MKSIIIVTNSHLNQSDDRSEYGTISNPGGVLVMRYRSLSSMLNVPERNQCQKRLRTGYQVAVSQGMMMASQMASMSWTTLMTQKACSGDAAKVSSDIEEYGGGG